jgi:hypothetical protein
MQHLYISWIVLVLLAKTHPFFLSLTEIKYNPGSKKMEVAQKIFWDDLETALGKHFNEKIDFLNPKDQSKLENQIRGYLLSHNEVMVNGKPLTLDFLGYEVDEDAAWFYFESSETETPKTVEVKNTILLDDFNGQQNIVHIYSQSKAPRSLLLGKGEEKGKIEF